MNRVKLNVGGTRYETTRETLQNSSMFRSWLTSWNLSEELFVDRDGQLFSKVLAVLRGSPYDDRDQVLAHELQYFGIGSQTVYLPQEEDEEDDRDHYQMGQNLTAIDNLPIRNFGKTLTPWERTLFPGTSFVQRVQMKEIDRKSLPSGLDQLEFLPWNLRFKSDTGRPRTAGQRNPSVRIRIYSNKSKRVLSHEEIVSERVLTQLNLQAWVILGGIKDTAWGFQMEMLDHLQTCQSGYQGSLLERVNRKASKHFEAMLPVLMVPEEGRATSLANPSLTFHRTQYFVSFIPRTQDLRVESCEMFVDLVKSLDPEAELFDLIQHGDIPIPGSQKPEQVPMRFHESHCVPLTQTKPGILGTQPLLFQGCPEATLFQVIKTFQDGSWERDRILYAAFLDGTGQTFKVLGERDILQAMAREGSYPQEPIYQDLCRLHSMAWPKTSMVFEVLLRNPLDKSCQYELYMVHETQNVLRKLHGLCAKGFDS